MDKPPDWTLYASFLAIAENGSLSAGAQVLGLSQPTLGRHLAALEAALGLTLFRRTPRGLALTDAGAELLPHARAMREAAARIGLAAAGRAADLTGTVRITASRIMANFLLPTILADLRRVEPGIDIELVASDATENLLFHEADIAVRMYRPTQLDIVSRHVCDQAAGLYAAPGYLDRRGRPDDLAALASHDFVGFDRSDLILRVMRGFGMERRREDFPVRCDDQIVYWSLVRAGWGIGGMQCVVGDADRQVERVAPSLALPALPVWLAAPQALRQSPRVRRVFDHLADALKAQAGA